MSAIRPYEEPLYEAFPDRDQQEHEGVVIHAVRIFLDQEESSRNLPSITIRADAAEHEGLLAQWGPVEFAIQQGFLPGGVGSTWWWSALSEQCLLFTLDRGTFFRAEILYREPGIGDVYSLPVSGV